MTTKTKRKLPLLINRISIFSNYHLNKIILIFLTYGPWNKGPCRVWLDRITVKWIRNKTPGEYFLRDDDYSLHEIKIKINLIHIKNILKDSKFLIKETIKVIKSNQLN